MSLCHVPISQSYKDLSHTTLYAGTFLVCQRLCAWNWECKCIVCDRFTFWTLKVDEVKLWTTSGVIVLPEVCVGSLPFLRFSCWGATLERCTMIRYLRPQLKYFQDVLRGRSLVAFRGIFVPQLLPERRSRMRLGVDIWLFTTDYFLGL